MRPFERRAANAYPYFKLSIWDARSFVWKVISKTHATEQDAIREASKPGRYRISRVDEAGKTELEPFTIA